MCLCEIALAYYPFWGADENIFFSNAPNREREYKQTAVQHQWHLCFYWKNTLKYQLALTSSKSRTSIYFLFW